MEAEKKLKTSKKLKMNKNPSESANVKGDKPEANKAGRRLRGVTSDKPKMDEAPANKVADVTSDKAKMDKAMSEALKAAIDKPQTDRAAALKNKNLAVILFGVNISGAYLEPEIFQIAAAYKNYSFNVYVAPKRGISMEVAKKTSFQVNSEGKLCWRKKPLDTCSTRIALEKFLAFLKLFGVQVILASYIARNHDSLWICKVMHEYGLWRKFTAIVTGFADIRLRIRDKLPERKNFRLYSLANDLLGIDISPTLYNVNNDLKSIQKIIQKLDIGDRELIDYSFPLSAVQDDMHALNSTKMNQVSMAFLRGFVPITMIEKLAKSGINYYKLKQAYKMNNLKGVELLLSGWTEGQPKVTDNQDLVQKINKMMQLLTKKKKTAVETI